MAASYAETKIVELAERKLRFDTPELVQEWNKINAENGRALIRLSRALKALGQDLGRSLTLSRTADKE